MKSIFSAKDGRTYPLVSPSPVWLDRHARYNCPSTKRLPEALALQPIFCLRIREDSEKVGGTLIWRFPTSSEFDDLLWHYLSPYLTSVVKNISGLATDCQNQLRKS